MSILPGWGSLESTAHWYWGFHVAGLVFILLLALSEILAFIYSKRADTLRGIAESARAEKRQQEKDEAKAFHVAEVEALKKGMGQAERRTVAIQREPTDRQLSPARETRSYRFSRRFAGKRSASSAPRMTPRDVDSPKPSRPCSSLRGGTVRE